MQRKKRIKRIGRYWIDKDIIDEGYDEADIFENNNLRLELPEMMDPTRRHKVAWLVCPICGERSQVERHDPSCSYCGWGEENDVADNRRPAHWAA